VRKIEKILLPVDFPNTSLSVIHQAAVLARHFNSEIVMLHVVTAESRRAGVPEYGSELADWDMLAVITQEAENDLDQSLGQELKHLAIRCVLCEGNPAQAILHTAQVEKADLIMMASHGAALNQFLVGSVTTKVLQGSGCPVWTDGRVEKSEASLAADNPMLLYGGAGMWMHGMRTVKHGEQRGPIPEFAIHNVLCAVDLGPRSNKAASWAAAMAAEFGAHLTLAHVTASVELWGPGGNYADPKLREELVDDASRRLAKLQQETGVKADTLIGSGDVPRVLSQAAKQTKADLLVTGCYPYDGNLRIHGYPIIWAVPIPVLSV
jgi:nucleotide-binding universal stress UspA family protein